MSGEWIFPMTRFSTISKAITRSDQMMAWLEGPGMKELRGSKELQDLSTLHKVKLNSQFYPHKSSLTSASQHVEATTG